MPASRPEPVALRPPALSVTVIGSSKINRQGSKLLSSLLSGDRLLIQARACKADLAIGTTPALTAARVIAHPEQA